MLKQRCNGSVIRKEPLYDIAFCERSMNGHRPRHDGRVGEIYWPLVAIHYYKFGNVIGWRQQYVICRWSAEISRAARHWADCSCSWGSGGGRRRVLMAVAGERDESFPPLKVVHINPASHNLNRGICIDIYEKIWMICQNGIPRPLLGWSQRGTRYAR